MQVASKTSKDLRGLCVNMRNKSERRRIYIYIFLYIFFSFSAKCWFREALLHNTISLSGERDYLHFFDLSLSPYISSYSQVWGVRYMGEGTNIKQCLALG